MLSVRRWPILSLNVACRLSSNHPFGASTQFSLDAFIHFVTVQFFALASGFLFLSFFNVLLLLQRSRLLFVTQGCFFFRWCSNTFWGFDNISPFHVSRKGVYIKSIMVSSEIWPPSFVLDISAMFGPLNLSKSKRILGMVDQRFIHIQGL